ncbi:MAG: hypothetical protein FJ255_00740 [Phycisphaerae bacterium]|nr:hypothetical protein [Phycisphaerae bacterium]
MREQAADRESWENHPLPARRALIRLERSYSPSEYARIARGLIPSQMEDKWFLFLEGDVLHCHRSWTGVCVYEVRFRKEGERFHVAECSVNRDPDQWACTDDAEDAGIVAFLIDRLLLGKTAQVGLHAASEDGTVIKAWSLFGAARAADEPLTPWVLTRSGNPPAPGPPASPG